MAHSMTSKPNGHGQHTTDGQGQVNVQSCIQACLECHNVCLQTLAYCLQKGGRHAAADHVRLLANCAEICQTSANFMMSGSPHHGLTCAVCAEICDLCAESCAAFGEDATMQRCADTCRRCAQCCHQMAHSMGVQISRTNVPA